MSGFINDPIERINQLSDLLRDRYKNGFPILKELIQNADDAKATEFDFGYLPKDTLKGAKHPLLSSPSLFFMNNGKFTKENDKAIRKMNVSNKADEKDSIGKFGLGMKSIFHLCEAYFYLSPDFQNFFNPWEPESKDDFSDNAIDERNKEWEDFADEDKQRIKDILKPTLENKTDYFIIWIPLRQKEHLKRKTSEIGAIIKEFPGNDGDSLKFIEDKETVINLTLLMPLLRHIESINRWVLQENSLQKDKDYSIEINQQPRIQFPDEPKDKFIGRTKSKIPVQYYGKEFKDEPTKWNELIKSDKWPERQGRNSNGQTESIKDKSIPHYSILFQRIEHQQNSFLKIQKAVFLPLTETEENIPIKDSKYQFYILLHGYFFIDSGRKDIIEPKEQDIKSISSEEHIRKCWNYRILESISEKFLETMNGFERDNCAHSGN